MAVGPGPDWTDRHPLSFYILAVRPGATAWCLSSRWLARSGARAGSGPSSSRTRSCLRCQFTQWVMPLISIAPIRNASAPTPTTDTYEAEQERFVDRILPHGGALPLRGHECLFGDEDQAGPKHGSYLNASRVTRHAISLARECPAHIRQHARHNRTAWLAV